MLHTSWIPSVPPFIPFQFLIPYGACVYDTPLAPEFSPEICIGLRISTAAVFPREFHGHGNK